MISLEKLTIELVGLASTSGLLVLQFMNLSFSRYHVGERVQGDVEKMLLEKVLVHHPQQAEKIGCGVDYFKVGINGSV